jgi:hypothetical protein
MIEETNIMGQQSAAAVVVAVNEREWIAVSSFSGAGANDAVYTLNEETGVITFGDGVNGARPPTGSTVNVSYQYGGGTAGNISKRIDDESQLTKFWIVTRADAQMVGWGGKPRSR